MRLPGVRSEALARAWTPAWWLLGAATLFGSVCFALTTTDIWWHLAAGRQMLQQSAWLHTDPFAADTLGRPWINLHWLFQLGALGVHHLGGIVGLVLVKSALAAGGAVLVMVAMSGTEERRWYLAPLTALCAVIPLHLARNLVLARPVVLTLLCLALFLLVLERHRRRGGARVLLWLIPVQLVWANAQGGLQLLGPAVVLSYVVGDGLGRLAPAVLHRSRASIRHLLLLSAGLPLCGMLTPHGLAGLSLPWTLLQRIDPVGSELFRLNVSENVPVWVFERQAAVPLEVASFKWVALATFASFLLVLLRRRPLDLSRLLLLTGLFGLALWANRNILLFAWVAGPVVVMNLCQLARGAISRRALVALVAASAAGLLLINAHRYLVIAPDEPPITELAPFRVPDRAVDRLEQLGLARGTLFNSVRYGGYLIWRHARPSIDGRLVLRTPAQFAEHLDLADGSASFADDRAPRAALLPTALPDRYLPLVLRLWHDPAWRLVFTDGTQTLFVRASCARSGGAPLGCGAERAECDCDHPPALDLTQQTVVRQIHDDLERRLAHTPAVVERATLHLGRLLAAMKLYPRALQVLQRGRSPATRSLLARVLYLDGQRQRAGALAQRLIEERGEAVSNLVLLALMAADRGERPRARELLQRALALRPRDVEARRLLARVGGE